MGTGLTNGEATDIAGTMVISGFESLTVEQNQGPLATSDTLKTTTIAALMAATRATLRGQNEIIIRNRQISDKIVLKAVT